MAIDLTVHWCPEIIAKRTLVFLTHEPCWNMSAYFWVVRNSISMKENILWPDNWGKKLRKLSHRWEWVRLASVCSSLDVKFCSSRSRACCLASCSFFASLISCWAISACNTLGAHLLISHEIRCFMLKVFFCIIHARHTSVAQNWMLRLCDVYLQPKTLDFKGYVRCKDGLLSPESWVTYVSVVA